jgi:hypothetical protein
VYDVQCEPSRASWLLPLLESELEEEVITRITEAIPRTRRRQNLFQYCELLLLLARKGRKSARPALYSAFRIDRDGSMIGDDEIIELDGAEGFVFVCEKLLAQVALENIDDIFGRIAYVYDMEYGQGEAEAIVRETLSLAPLLSHFEPEPVPDSTPWNDPQHSKKSVEGLSATDILTLIDSTDSQFYIKPVSLWSRSASEEQLEDLARALAHENSTHRLRHILSIFRRRPLPLFEAHSDAFLKLATQEDWHVKHRANTALSSVTHPKIRKLALAQLCSQNWLVGELLPLKSNFSPGDSTFFTQHLRVDRNTYNHHRLIFDLVEVCRANPWPEMLEVMQFIYQTSPCTNCRDKIYQVMSKASLIPGWIVSERPYDMSSPTWD